MASARSQSRLRSALAALNLCVVGLAVFAAAVALICLPFAAAIHASTHGPWLRWGDAGQRRIM